MRIRLLLSLLLCVAAVGACARPAPKAPRPASRLLVDDLPPNARRAEVEAKLTKNGWTVSLLKAEEQRELQVWHRPLGSLWQASLGLHFHGDQLAVAMLVVVRPATPRRPRSGPVWEAPAPAGAAALDGPQFSSGYQPSPELTRETTALVESQAAGLTKRYGRPRAAGKGRLVWTSPDGAVQVTQRQLRVGLIQTWIYQPPRLPETLQIAALEQHLPLLVELRR